MQYIYPLTAIHFSGETLMLYSSDAVLSFIKQYGRFTEHHVSYFYDWKNLIHYRKIDGWIVRDDFGRVVKYEDFCYQYKQYEHYNERMAKLRKIAEKGLPIPRTGCRKAGHKMNHTAKKNSGSGHRNRNRAKIAYEASEYGFRNNSGRLPWSESW